MPVIVRGDGPYVWDSPRQALPRRAVRAVRRRRSGTAAPSSPRRPRSRRRSSRTSRSGRTRTPTAIELAERLASLAPGDLNRVFFTTGGGEAVESAWKLARQYFKLIGEPTRYKVISRYIAYHGTTMGALSITGVPEIKAPFEPLVPGAMQGARTRTSTGRRARRRPGGVRPVGGRRDRAGDRDGGRRDRRRGVPGAGAELRRLLPAAARLLPAGARDLRPTRRAARLRRGDLRVRPARPLVRRRSATTTSPTSSPWPRA